MIFRLSQKLAKKLKTSPPRPAPADPNPFADWSAHLFTADRTQYLILTNTPSLYSTVIYARGIPNDSQFLDRALSSIREFMVDDGQEFIFRRLIAPTTVSVRFASALNRSFTGSMNDLVYHAQTWLAKGDISPFDVGSKLNEIPFSSLGYRNPREVFKALGAGQSGFESGDA
jgi:phosphoribosyl-ATP pyrophosphohydrolase